MAARTKRGVLPAVECAGVPPVGAEITGYNIQWKEDKEGEDYSSLVITLGNALRTHHTHGVDPKEDEVRLYRVRTVVNSSFANAPAANALMSDWVEVRYPAYTMMTPGKPMLSAMKDAAMPASQINLTWTGPEMADATVTGYIIERAYGDVMFLDAADGVAHPHFAFSNRMEWWETLNCAGMLNAVGSDEDPMGSGPDKMMYCARYDMTAPSNTTGTIMAGSDVDMKIEEYFMKRYVITDAMAMSYTDMGLMPNTDYSYRIRSAHGMDAGMWSETAMETTDLSNTPLGNAMGLTATAGSARDVVLTWTPGTNATIHWIAGVRVINGAIDPSFTPIWLRRRQPRYPHCECSDCRRLRVRGNRWTNLRRHNGMEQVDYPAVPPQVAESHGISTTTILS